MDFCRVITYFDIDKCSAYAYVVLKEAAAAAATMGQKMELDFELTHGSNGAFSFFF